MAHIKKTVTAGCLVMQAVYPRINPRDSEAVRAGKRKHTSAAQQRLNDKSAYRQLELLLAANFCPNDIYLTLTYDDKHLPKSRAEAMNEVANFKERLKRRRNGENPRYVYVSEHKHGDGRWHHHMVINSSGEDYEQMLEAWGKGHIEFKRLRVDRDKNYETLARYLCKEMREKVGNRLWNSSKNLIKPETDRVSVANDETLEPPRGAIVLEDSGNVSTIYGHYRFIKYMLTNEIQKGKRARRKKRRR